MTDISAFGDSVLKGVIFENNKYKVSKNSFVCLCEKLLGIKVENKAKFGSTITTGEKSIEKNIEVIKNSNSKYAIMEFGGNDCDYTWKEISDNPLLQHTPKNSINEFVQTYTNLINNIKEIGKMPVLLSLPPIDSNKYFNKITQGLNSENILKWMNGNKHFLTNWHERYNIEVFKLAIKNHVPIIDITSKFLEMKRYEELLCDDGIHPNEKGHKLIAEVINEHVHNKCIEL